MKKIFKIEDERADNWLVASLGRDVETNKDYYLTTNKIPASELNLYSFGAKRDGLLMAKLLNLYHNGLMA